MKTTTYVELTFDGPCADRGDQLLALATGTSDPAESVKTQDHVRRCNRCRSHLESLRSESRLAKGAFSALAPKRASLAPRTAAAFEDWIGVELKTRSERELADCLWRLGNTVLRMDPCLGSTFNTDNPTASVAEWAEAAKSEQTFLMRLTPPARSRRIRRNAGATTESLEAISTAVARALREEVVSTPRGRAAVVVELIRQCHELAGGHHGGAHLLQARLQWSDTDAAVVMRELELSALHPANALQRAAATNNLSLWTLHLGNERTGMELSRAASLIAPSFVTPGFNRLAWNLVKGDERAAGVELRDLIASAPARKLAMLYPAHRILRLFERLAPYHEGGTSRWRGAADRVILAFSLGQFDAQ